MIRDIFGLKAAVPAFALLALTTAAPVAAQEADSQPCVQEPAGRDYKDFILGAGTMTVIFIALASLAALTSGGPPCPHRPKNERPSGPPRP